MSQLSSYAIAQKKIQGGQYVFIHTPEAQALQEANIES